MPKGVEHIDSYWDENDGLWVFLPLMATGGAYAREPPQAAPNGGIACVLERTEDYTLHHETPPGRYASGGGLGGMVSVVGLNRLEAHRKKGRMRVGSQQDRLVLGTGTHFASSGDNVPAVDKRCTDIGRPDILHLSDPVSADAAGADILRELAFSGVKIGSASPMHPSVLRKKAAGFAFWPCNSGNLTSRGAVS
jgi:hypothetical protein